MTEDQVRAIVRDELNKAVNEVLDVIPSTAVQELVSPSVGGLPDLPWVTELFNMLLGIDGEGKAA